MLYLRALPFLVVTAIILFAGLKPEPVPQLFEQQDKLHHLLGFAALTFTLHFAAPRLPFSLLLLISLGLALTIELGQSFSPNRTVSAADMLANSVGILLGWLCSQLADAVLVIMSDKKNSLGG